MIEEACTQSSAIAAEAASYARRVQELVDSNHNLKVELEQLHMASVRL